MKNSKFLLVILLASFACTVYAQDDDWQIGGGYNSQSSNSRHASYIDRNYSPGSVTLWNGGHEDAPVGIVFGYVNKQWISNYGGTTIRENFFGQEGKRFHGLQIGLLFNPCFKYGLGIRTGAFYEAYFSNNQKVKEQGWDQFTESDLYIPAHLSMRFPFSRKAALTIYGGIGFQWAISGQYRLDGYEDYDPYDHSTHYYGPRGYQAYGQGWPKHVNWQLEGGFNLRFNPVILAFTYSYGLTNHHLYQSVYDDSGAVVDEIVAENSRQDKLSISLGFVF